MAVHAMPLGGLRPMGDVPRNISLDPMVPVIRRILTDVDFMRPLKTAVDCIDSSTLVNVSLVSLKSLPYVLYGDNRMVQEFDNGISCRMRYLETAVTSLASLVYNVVFGAVFSVLSLVTLGQVKMIVDQMRKHWTHTALAVAATAISAVGTVSPELGVKANAAGMFAIGVAVMQWLQGDVIGRLAAAYQQHRQELRDAALQGIGGDRGFYNRDIVPFFNYLDQNFDNRIQSFSDLLNVVQGAQELLPHVVPTVTTDVIIDNVQQLLSNWRDSGHHPGVTVRGTGDD
ncbi:MAG: hypothetical protein JSS60_05820 [Verrucomicrobia bacterium]|nr:hypothetical protein [Verrucomicrobiota bacterium]